MRAKADVPTGYTPEEIETWATRIRGWAAGQTVPETAPVAKAAPVKPRDVYVFFINGAKERAPAGARAMLATLA